MKFKQFVKQNNPRCKITPINKEIHEIEEYKYNDDYSFKSTVVSAHEDSIDYFEYYRVEAIPNRGK